MENDKAQVNIKMPKPLVAKLDEYVKQHDTSRPAVVIALLEKLLSGEEGPQLPFDAGDNGKHAPAAVDLREIVTIVRCELAAAMVGILSAVSRVRSTEAALAVARLFLSGDLHRELFPAEAQEAQEGKEVADADPGGDVQS